MDRRAFLVLTLAGCADPSNRVAVGLPGIAPPAPTPQQPAPVQPLPASGDATFDAWLNGFYQKMVTEGFPSTLLDRELAGLTPEASILVSDKGQPELSKPFSKYIIDTVSDARIAIGRQMHVSQPILPVIESQYGVPRDLVLAVWAMESAFGKVQGDHDVLRAFATLAWQGRRRAWAEDELRACLRIISSGEAPRERLKGSWAGAMGQTQFLPSVYLSTAVDGDHDGKRDIWGSSDDALASTANYMLKAGWAPGQSWAREVTLPASFDYSVAEGPKNTPIEWATMGVTRADGLPWSGADAAVGATLFLPTGARGPAFLLFPNHFVIRKYNNAATYALAVGLLADRFGGEGPLIKAWPPETGLLLADRLASQRALQAAGFYKGDIDGAFGTGGRAALRLWQKARGYTPDGYLSPEMVVALKAELAAGIPDGPAPAPVTPPQP
ncbi:MAG: peptidoglycan-binding protein [Caulobacter sp.]|nr:peptidoglycan-binding protein [Caulobacter sp.]